MQRIGWTRSGFVAVATVITVFACTTYDKSKPVMVEDTRTDTGDSGVAAGDVLDLVFPEVKPDQVGDASGDVEVILDPCVAEPGSFGCPCVGNTDCLSGYCVGATHGSVCTIECLEECPEDWICTGMSGFGTDVVFLCVPPHKPLCIACESDLDCSGERCVELDNTDVCVYGCVSDSECPMGFRCQPIDGGKEQGTWCMPMTGSCTCLPENHGETRPCLKANPFGTCNGYEACDARLGWKDCSAAIPGPELCDGVDNDCDGKYDEDLPEFQPCQNSVEDIGTCQGNAVCDGVAGWVCLAQTPEEESCDYWDDDCDGLVDEDFKDDGKYVHPEHCGSCNQLCEGTIANGTAFCDASLPMPQCSVLDCDEGYYAANSFQCLPEGQTQCKPCFNDLQCEGGKCITMAGQSVCVEACPEGVCPEFAACTTLDDGEVDWCVPMSEDCTCTGGTQGKMRPCAATNVEGTCYGQEVCDPEVGWVDCNAPIPAAEICDGKDNNCNGITDDGLPIGDLCEKTIPDVGTCKGVKICLGEQGWLCNAANPTVESCDYADNDCDGFVDEDFKQGDKYVDFHHCGSCNKDCEGALPNAVAYCDHLPLTPVCKVDQCKPGFYPLNEFQCISPPDVQCVECASDADCYLMVCAQVEGAKHCLKPCIHEFDCGPMYSCVDAGDGLGKLCRPTTGSCQCTPANAGLEWACKTTNEFGTCFGIKTCTANGWGPCDAKTPATETCNGIDDDCDGLIDEDLPATKPCEQANEFGVCEGVSTCVGAQGWVCQAQVPAAEKCDYLDNDCDGLVDETFKEGEKYILDMHCGTCNNDCPDALPHATGKCDASYALPKCVVDECEPGYFQVSPFQCILPPDTSCQACQVDADCLGGKCLVIDGEKRCAVECEDDDDCFGETSCQTVAGDVDRCLPVSGSCTCSSGFAGAKRSCSTASDYGTCFGFETCDPELGWSECDALVAAPEICDGVDNDCNGMTDDGLPASEPCQTETEYGTCSGFAVCMGTPGWVCQAPYAAEESCDYMDNDCDGLIDEDFKVAGKYVMDAHCGTCNNDCLGAIPNAEAICNSTYPVPKCVVEDCLEGYVQVGPFQCIVPPDTTCQACDIDDDCLGGICMEIDQEMRCAKPCEDAEDCSGENVCQSADGLGWICLPASGSCECSSETAGAKRSCSIANALGTCYGFETCDAELGWSACDAQVPAEEICDGIDNDCNGLTDEWLPETQPCDKSNQWGSCSGLAVCAGTPGWVCQAPEPAAEKCDYIDNDCDGTTDEDFKAGEKYFTDAHCGTCNNACEDAIPHASGICDPTYPVPKCIVDDCDEGYFAISPFQCILPPDTTCQACAVDADCLGSLCVSIDNELRCAKPCQTNADCSGETTCQPAPGLGTICLPVSGSCGCSSQTAGAKRSCSVTNELGTCYGFETCFANTGWSACDAQVPAVEICDGIDNDCNGLTDEWLPETQDCEKSNEFGTCTGLATCAGTPGWVCQAPVPKAEVCDYADNDCDGASDEDFKSGGKYHTDAHCGSCNNACADAIDNATGKCDPTYPVPKCVVASCDEGYYKLSPFQCILPPDTTCQACEEDADCLGSLCVEIDGELRCALSCTTNADCSGETTCQNEPGIGNICLPVSGSCACSSQTAGAKRSCSVTNEVGTCFGFETCFADTGWSACDAQTPATEICNGKDDDCNGLTDEWLPQTQPCDKSNQWGTCEGLAICQGTLGWVCQAQVPAEDICDYTDNDCDGSVDDDWLHAGKYDTLHHCGSCNKDCQGALPNATAYCDATGANPACKVESCNPGYFQLNDFQCILPPDVLCAPCLSDDDCYFDQCVPIDGGDYCLPACDQGACPDAYHCESVPGWGDLCIPDTQSCECDANSAGNTRSCSAENQYGTCFGLETCDPLQGWVSCTAKVPAAEVCDGADNDCNGLVDDALPDTQPCSKSNQYGTCEGLETCNGKNGWVCQASVPAAESCDYSDNDCDGTVDETFKVGGKYVTDEHCGTCNNSCIDAIDNATGKCDASYLVPKCVVDQCEPGYYKLSPFQCILPPDTTCQACAVEADCLGSLCVSIDAELRCAKPCTTNADCSGETTCQNEPGVGNICLPVSGSCACSSQTAGAKRSCSITNALGTCYGFETCDAVLGWSECDAQTPAAETCNGIDDDCNGLTDEWLPDTQDCEKSNQWGTCDGLAICAGTPGWVCQAQTPAQDICDYQDNDCDGAIDEDFKSGGKYYTDAHCGACNNSCTGAIPHASAVCDPSYATPKCVVDECDPGYFQISAFQCIVPPDTTCYTCTVHADCLGGHCLLIDGSKRCVIPCVDNNDCAGETSCAPVAGVGNVCMPVTGSCTCNSFTAGSKRSCSVSNATGTCYGFETCDAAQGWLPCDASTPAPEVCDGKDNECDGQIDEGLPATQPCSKANQYGECDGVEICLGIPGWVCQASVPAPEACDYVDNDCDGSVDEDFKTGSKYTALAHCGSCNKSCVGALPNATAYCDSVPAQPVCKVQSCDEGYYQLNEYQCIWPPEVECQECTDDGDCYFHKCAPTESGTHCLATCQVEADCNPGYSCTDVAGVGLVCKPDTNSCDCTPASHGIKRACSIENQYGECYGFETCDGATGWLPCDAKIPAAEVCDGKDNDCDGLEDDGLPDTLPCEKSNEWGTCTGESICMGLPGWVCQAATPAQDICDYQDNDCDGTVDEDFKSGNKYVDDLHCGSCNNACPDAIPNATGICDPTPAVPRCIVESCDEGYYKLSDFQCVVPPDSTCDPCVTEANCYGSPCILIDGVSRCAIECVTDNDCAAGYTCETYGGLGTLCQPITGSCECDAQTAGAKRTCNIANAFGTCYGFETCDPVAGWSACDAKTPAPEDCDGTDNDCDGFTDEGLPASIPCSESNEHGTCSGTATCAGTQGWDCNAPVPTAETCDHEDNDCDGYVDEDFRNAGGLYDEFLHCGDCNLSCKNTVANGTAMCDATGDEAYCKVATCNPGYFQLGEFQCLPDTAALCEACTVSADCAAAKFSCLTYNLEKFCTKDCSAESCPAGYTCTTVPAGQRCIPDTGSCNCDGSDLTLSRACQETWPPDVPEGEADTVCLGYQPCTLEGWGDCILPGEACDAIDNDCDGMVDEDFKDGGEYIHDEHCGACGNDCTDLPYDNVVGSCDPAVSPPECVIDCLPGFFDPNGLISDGCECEYVGETDLVDGIDQNCDGMDGEVDNGLFVAEWGDDGNAGTIDSPLRTIHTAMLLSPGSGKRDIYVGGGYYEGSLTLVEGVKLYGGYSDNFMARDSMVYESTVDGDDFTALAPAPLTALNITGAAGSTVVDGFTFVAVNATTPGGSSYAVYLRNCTNGLIVRRNIIIAGNGAPGNQGSAGGNGSNGAAGTPGLAAVATNSNICTGGEILAGGVGATKLCGDVVTSGGSGGTSHCPTYEGGPKPEENGLPGSGAAPGAGGLAGWDGKIHHASCKMCTFPQDEIVEGEDGWDGESGQNGLPGLGCNVPSGQPGTQYWYAATGSAAGKGLPGSGGGGGGSGGGGDSDTSKCYDVVGGTGGGGGSGGCAGTGGSGGTGGGGSFGLFVVFTTTPASVPTVEDNMMVAGYGGAGGQGGTGGSGGAGGAGAPGGAAGASDVYCTFGGGAGGYGGTGGHGGGGGGGCGGVSFCSFAIKPAGLNLLDYKTENSCVLGMPGAGGLGGVSFGVVGQNGQAGLFGQANF